MGSQEWIIEHEVIITCIITDMHCLGDIVMINILFKSVFLRSPTLLQVHKAYQTDL